MGDRQVVERYARALADGDLDAQDVLLHDDYIGRYPQSGELVRGRANRRAILENYPGVGEGLRPTLEYITGRDDQFVSGPSFPAWTIIHLAGSGEEITLLGRVRYPDGLDWHVITLLIVREGKIWRETNYYAPPFDPPEWRSAYVELTKEAGPTPQSAG